MPNITNPQACAREIGIILDGANTQFPMPFNWTCDEDDELYPTETGESRARIQFHTLTWLVESGYLSHRGGWVGGRWQELRLTERGLRVLNSVPQVLSGKEPLGTRLRAVVAKGAVDGIGRIVAAIFQQGIQEGLPAWTG